MFYVHLRPCSRPSLKILSPADMIISLAMHEGDDRSTSRLESSQSSSWSEAQTWSRSSEDKQSTMPKSPGQSTYRIAEGQTGRLPCSSTAFAETNWRKDGALISSSADSNLIQADDGSLIIAAARLPDSGNYICSTIAEASINLPSTSTEVIVYVDGAWSPWSSWHGTCPQTDGPTSIECTVLRGQLAMTRGGPPEAVSRALPRQRRQRACNNPAPLNGGKNCSQGADEEFRMCRHGCTLDGSWSPWTEWTDCNSSCGQWRRRACDAPSPANGGAPCVGEPAERRDCDNCSNVAVISKPSSSRTDYGGSPETSTRQSGYGGLVKNFTESSDYSISNANLAKKTAYSNMAAGRLAYGGATITDGDAPPLYVLASLGCVSFLLIVIAVLVAALLYSRPRGVNGNGKKRRPPTDYRNTVVSDDSAASPTLYLAGENGGKTIYHPIVDHCKADVYPTPMTDPHRRYPTVAGSRFFMLAAENDSAKSTPSRFVRHTASLSTGAGIASRRQFDVALPSSVQGQDGDGNFLRSSQLAESRLPLIGLSDGQRAPFSSASSSSGRLPYASSESAGGSLPTAVSGGDRQLAAYSPYYDTQTIDTYRVTESENNYATLYEPPAYSRCHNVNASPREDSGNHSGSEIGMGNNECYGRRRYDTPSGYSIRPKTAAGKKFEEGAPTLIVAQVDSECARIELKRSGVSLTIGEFAFADEHTVFLAVSDHVEDRPQLAEDETWLSAIVSYGNCGPTMERAGGVSPPPQMRRPVVLSFEHCASLFPKDNWQFILYGDLSNNGPSLPSASDGYRSFSAGRPSQWERMCVVGDEDLNTRCYVQLERERCHVMTAGFGHYLLAGRPHRTGALAPKRIHLAAYYCSGSTINTINCHMVENTIAKSTVTAQNTLNYVSNNTAVDNATDTVDINSKKTIKDPTESNDRFDTVSISMASIRVYCVPETQMCVQSVRQQEEQAGGVLLAEAENFPMLPRGALSCCLEEIGAGYAPAAEAGKYMEIGDDQHEWCSQNGLHFVLNLRRLRLKSMDTYSIVSEEDQALLVGRIVIHQQGNPTKRQILGFRLDTETTCRLVRQKSDSPGSVSQRGLADLPGARDSSQEHQASPLTSPFQLSYVLKQRLCERLDKSSGWSALAQRLGLDRYVQYFGTHPGCSPTSLVLDLWEATAAADGGAALLAITQAFRQLGVADALLPYLPATGGGSTGYRTLPPPRLPPPPPPDSTVYGSAPTPTGVILNFE